MAFLLYNYLRRKVQESKEKNAPHDITEESHLTPEFTNADGSKSEGQNTLDGNTSNGIHLTRPLSTEQLGESRKFKEDARKLRAYRWRMILGLLLPNFLASVDVTIVAPAIPTISSHFSMLPLCLTDHNLTCSDHLSGSFNWIVAAYTLTFTTFVPASGQIADIYGRHFALHFQMVWILIGSVLCAAAVTWPMLLFGRALQGLGAAGSM
jgi:hypothetical protein